MNRKCTIFSTHQVQSATTVKGADNVDIGCGNAFGGEDEAVDDSVEKVFRDLARFLRNPMHKCTSVFALVLRLRTEATEPSIAAVLLCSLTASILILHSCCSCELMQVNNVIDPFKYTEVPFGTKSELKEYLKVCGRRLGAARAWSGSSFVVHVVCRPVES